MKENSQLRPDPMLPEHLLIRQAAALPVLSRQLKSQVMSNCQHQITLARWKFRLKVGLSLTVACCLMVCLGKRLSDAGSISSDSTPGPSVNAAPTPRPSTGNLPYRPGQGSQIAADQLNPPASLNELQERENPGHRLDMEQIQRTIEQLQQRERKLCGILPWL